MYKPDLSKKKLSDLKKVELLEEVVQKGKTKQYKEKNIEKKKEEL